jgi:hypothetical protein
MGVYCNNNLMVLGWQRNLPAHQPLKGATTMCWLNISTRRVGGLRFIKIGRFTLMFCASREYRPL